MTDVGAARARIVGAALLFSTGGAAIKACSLTGWQVACFRSGIAAIAVALLLPSARRAILSWRAWLVGVAYAGTLTCFVLANKLTTSANAIFLQSTAPLYLVLLGPWLLREPVRRRDAWFLGALAVGLACFFVGSQEPLASAPDPVRGNLVAVASGVAWAFTVSGLRWAGRAEETRPGTGAAAVVAGNVLAFACALPFALPLVGARDVDWLVLLYLGVVQIGLAYALLSVGMRHVTALEASLLLLVEPVVNPFWAWWAQGEVPSSWALMGCVLILGTTAARTIVESRFVARSGRDSP